MQDWLDYIPHQPLWLKLLTLAIATFVSEDLTCISAGILVSQDTIHFSTATIGCFLGIFVGDGLLYLVGLVFGKPVLKLPIMRHLLTEERVNRAQVWFRENGLKVVILSRFIPGTRLPTYFAAGLLGSEAKFFLMAAGIATAIWTPIIVAASYFFGAQIQSLLSLGEKYKVPGLILGVILFYVLLRIILALTDWRKRRLLLSRLYRFRRWEFWPILVVYAPVFVYNLWLILKFRRFTLPLSSNPGIEFSGFIGESKIKIMHGFQGVDEYFGSHCSLEPASVEVRLNDLETWRTNHQVAYPIVLKPDVGQRGSGVKRAYSLEDARLYLEETPLTVVAMEYIPGPYEFGVYYVRFPNEDKGRILGLTGKEFPSIVGNGKDSLETLILTHPPSLGRYHIFIKRFRHRLDEIPAQGEVIPMVHAGNHCLGTIFNDSSHLITETMETKFDEISKTLNGFYIGRYDVRASNLEDFRRGQHFKIMELNGATGEPSHMYDVRYGFFHGLLALFRHYRYLWEIGRQNVKRGTTRTPMSALIRAGLDYRRQARSHPKGE